MEEVGWLIKGNCGFYVGWWQTRKKAITEHCCALELSWKECRKKGDRAVKVSISEIAS